LASGVHFCWPEAFRELWVEFCGKEFARSGAANQTDVPDRYRILEGISGVPSCVEDAIQFTLNLAESFGVLEKGVLVERAAVLLTASANLKDTVHLQAVQAALWKDGSMSYLHTALAPALRSLGRKQAFKSTRSVATRLLLATLAAYEAEIQRDILPYPDWRRPGFTHNRELAAFLADPQASTHDFPRNEMERGEIIHLIKYLLLDLDYQTIKVGRPFTLRCVKNDNSYHTALKLRKEHQRMLLALQKLAASS
jgi:hypothetical protein